MGYCGWRGCELLKCGCFECVLVDDRMDRENPVILVPWSV